MGILDGLLNTAQAPGGILGNSQYALPSNNNYNTELPFLDEMQFRQWLKDRNVPFSPDTKNNDYDMRGFFAGLMGGNPMAATAINQNDGKLHFPDYWKTPYHMSFSNESKWAKPVAPRWNENDQLVSPGGRILYDERARR